MDSEFPFEFHDENGVGKGIPTIDVGSSRPSRDLVSTAPEDAGADRAHALEDDVGVLHGQEIGHGG